MRISSSDDSKAISRTWPILRNDNLPALSAGMCNHLFETRLLRNSDSTAMHEWLTERKGLSMTKEFFASRVMCRGLLRTVVEGDIIAVKDPATIAGPLTSVPVWILLCSRRMSFALLCLVVLVLDGFLCFSNIASSVSQYVLVRLELCCLLPDCCAARTHRRSGGGRVKEMLGLLQ